jgi:hypothetical protein
MLNYLFMKQKYFTVGVLCLLFMQSCKVLRQTLAEKVTAFEGCQKISFDHNKVFIHTLIEGREQVMRLDLGAESSVITDTTTIPGYYKRSKSTFGNAYGVDRKTKITTAHLPLKIRNKLHASDNKVFMVIPRPQELSDCALTQSTSYAGLYGYDLMKQYTAGYLLDFETEQICNLKKEELSSMLAKGYQPIKAKIGDWDLVIYVTIDGVEYAFKFDTGYNGTFIMPYNNEKIGFLSDNHTSLEGMLVSSASGIVTGKNNYYQKQVIFGGKEYAAEITVSQGVKAQNVGMGFIKAFNWIIDSKNKKVYIRKNEMAPDKGTSHTQGYYAAARGGKLIVIARPAGSHDYVVGDEIVSVNGREATVDNFCELVNLLNEQKNNWKVLKVITHKPE